MHAHANTRTHTRAYALICPCARLPQPVWCPALQPLNTEQKAAVRAILRAQHAPLPYLILGPPGTGKTNTTAEAAVQVGWRGSGVSIWVGYGYGFGYRYGYRYGYGYCSKYLGRLRVRVWV